jgi:hypothetical protein
MTACKSTTLVNPYVSEFCKVVVTSTLAENGFLCPCSVKIVNRISSLHRFRILTYLQKFLWESYQNIL